MSKKIPNILEKKQKSLDIKSDVLSWRCPTWVLYQIGTCRSFQQKCIMTMKVIMRILLVKLCIPLITKHIFHMLNKKGSILFNILITVGIIHLLSLNTIQQTNIAKYMRSMQTFMSLTFVDLCLKKQCAFSRSLKSLQVPNP